MASGVFAPGALAASLMKTLPGGVGAPLGFKVGVSGGNSGFGLMPEPAKVPSFVGTPTCPIPSLASLESEPGAAQAIPASGTDRVPAAIMATIAVLIMFGPPSRGGVTMAMPLSRSAWESSLSDCVTTAVARYCNVIRIAAVLVSDCDEQNGHPACHLGRTNSAAARVVIHSRDFIHRCGLWWGFG
ncbi:hypothetical protein, partial [Mycolicibacterium agri]|uniref:hypothetical protein n=1 Tax=Mycolicibacterium agri TaxID=36811 RepID=UPI001A9C4F52